MCIRDSRYALGARGHTGAQGGLLDVVLGDLLVVVGRVGTDDRQRLRRGFFIRGVEMLAGLPGRRILGSREVNACRGRRWRGGIKVLLQRDGLEGLGRELGIGAPPVSYTHLDVYKRQDLN